MSDLRTLLLLGASGRLGRVVRAVADEVWQVQAPAHAELDLATMKTSDWDAVLARVRPAAVVNCAALADVDGCERDPEAAIAVNGEGPLQLALALRGAGVPLLHLSTDYVFGDGAGPFDEGATRSPVQQYGLSKIYGEVALEASEARVAIARVSWLFGPTGGAFADYVLGQVDGSGDPVAVHSRQLSRPTWIPGLVGWLLAIAARLADGDDVPRILHPAGGPWASRADWARAILDGAGHPGIEVVDQGDHGAMRATRPLDSRLDGAATSAWCAAHGLPPLDDWRMAYNKAPSGFGGQVRGRR